MTIVIVVTFNFDATCHNLSFYINEEQIMPRERYMTYVLVDPRAPEYPRYVGYGPAPYPWELHLDFIKFGTGRLYDWLREMDGLGLGPIVPSLFLFGSCPFMRHSRESVLNFCELIESFFRNRAEELGDHSDFLFNDPLPTVQQTRRVTATDTNGKVIAFDSIADAHRAGFTRSCIYDALNSGRCYRGYLWKSQQSELRQYQVDRVVKDGLISTFPSIAAASRETGVSRPWIVRLLQTAERDPKGGRWRHSANPEALVRKPLVLQSSGYRIFEPVVPLNIQHTDNLCHLGSAPQNNQKTLKKTA